MSQTNEDGSQKDEFRKVEAVFKSKRFGEVDFGKGDPATKDIARLDLSGTDILAYAKTGDPAGGLLFRTKDDDDLTTINVNSVFTDFDSGRTNRIRYDTPEILRRLCLGLVWGRPEMGRGGALGRCRLRADGRRPAPVSRTRARVGSTWSMPARPRSCTMTPA